VEGRGGKGWGGEVKRGDRRKRGREGWRVGRASHSAYPQFISWRRLWCIAYR